MFCGKCGKPMSEREEILSDGCLHVIGSCFECNIQKDIGIVGEDGLIPTENVPMNNIYIQKTQMYNVQQGNAKAKKKDSALSTIACVFSFVSFFIPIFIAIIYVAAAFAVAVVDLAIHDDKKKHIGSWLALVFCFFVTLLIWAKLN